MIDILNFGYYNNVKGQRKSNFLPLMIFAFANDIDQVNDIAINCNEICLKANV